MDVFRHTLRKEKQTLELSDSVVTHKNVRRNMVRSRATFENIWVLQSHHMPKEEQQKDTKLRPTFGLHYCNNANILTYYYNTEEAVESVP